VGPWELIIILLICVIIFGAGRLSEIGGAVGKSVREFRKATQDDPAQAASTNAATSPTSNNSTSTAAATQSAGAAVAAPAKPAENKCPSCGTLNPGSQVFCGQCGTRLTVAA
jgi:sec-independent protein translocase protein TatA